jgi:hypothetical protein
LREQLARWFPAEDCEPQSNHAVIETKTFAVTDAHRSPFEPLDLAHMIDLWGSEANVKALLDSFVSAVRDDLLALLPLLDECDTKRLREWHHRLAGAVGVLQYPALLAVLEAYRKDMDRHDAERLRERGLEVIRTCQAMLDDIEQQAVTLA